MMEAQKLYLLAHGDAKKYEGYVVLTPTRVSP
jgi:hypothetical protein